MIAIKDSIVLARDQKMQSLQHEIEDIRHHLRKLNEQLESSEETTVILQNTITQRDKEIAELREIPATLQNTITQQDKKILELNEYIEHNRGEARQSYINMLWGSFSLTTPLPFAPTSAVVDNLVYLSDDSFSIPVIWQSTLSLRQ